MARRPVRSTRSAWPASFKEAREQRLIAAAKAAIPWLVLLGNYIGNGTKDLPEGRCEVLGALHEALGEYGVQVVNSFPARHAHAPGAGR